MGSVGNDDLVPKMKTSEVFEYATGSTALPSKQQSEEKLRESTANTRNIQDPFLNVPASERVNDEKKELVLTKRSMVSQESFENDPDRPANAINSTLIVEEIDINGLT